MKPSPTYGRMAVLVCSLAPMLVWPLSGHHLAHPWQGGAWGLLCAVLAATTPARYLRLALVLQTLAFPLTVGWIGVIAVTGYGPSSAEFEAATSGSIHEVWMATQLACMQIAFIVTATFTFWTLAWAWRANWRVFQSTINSNQPRRCVVSRLTREI